MNVCDVCGFEAKTPQALGAHRALKHGVAGKAGRQAPEPSVEAVGHSVADLAGKLEAFEKRQTEAYQALTNAVKGLATLVMDVQQTNDRLRQLVEAVEQRESLLADSGADVCVTAEPEVETGAWFEPAIFDRNNEVLDDLDCYFGASDMFLGERIELVKYGDQMCVRILKDPEDIAGYLAKRWPDYSLQMDTEGYIWVVHKE